MENDFSRFANSVMQDPDFQQARLRSMGVAPDRAIAATQPLIQQRHQQAAKGQFASILQGAKAEGRELNEQETIALFQLDPQAAERLMGMRKAKKQQQALSQMDINSPEGLRAAAQQMFQAGDVKQGNELLNAAEKLAQQGSLDMQRNAIFGGGGFGAQSGGVNDYGGGFSDLADDQLIQALSVPEYAPSAEYELKRRSDSKKSQAADDVAAEGAARSEKLINSANTKVTEAFNLLDNDLFDSATGMFSDTLAGVKPSSDAKKLRSAIKTIQANLSIDSLIEAKKQGATFGALTEKELDLLGAMVADLDPSLGEETLRKNLNQIREFLGKSGSSTTTQQVTPELLEAMTPEDRALFQ